MYYCLCRQTFRWPHDSMHSGAQTLCSNILLSITCSYLTDCGKCRECNSYKEVTYAGLHLEDSLLSWPKEASCHVVKGLCKRLCDKELPTASRSLECCLPKASRKLLKNCKERNRVDNLGEPGSSYISS